MDGPLSKWLTSNVGPLTGCLSGHRSNTGDCIQDAQAISCRIHPEGQLGPIAGRPGLTKQVDAG